MRNFLFFFILLLSSFSLFAAYETDIVDPYNERVLHFHSDIRIQKNREVIVTETIEVNCRQFEIKRGIFREIPLSYNGLLSTYHVDFNLLSVKKDGKSEPYHTEWMENGIKIYIGDADIFLESGVYTYEIKYKLDYVLTLDENSDVDEFYWNVNGNGWQLDFDSISATVRLPDGAEVRQYKCYTGRYGSQNENYTAIDDTTQITFIGNDGLLSGEGLTVIVGWDKGFVDLPTTKEEMVRHIWMYVLIYGGLLTLLIGFAYNFTMWFLYGRDPKPGTIIPRFYPPKGMSPAEVAYLDNEGRRTDTMISSAVLGIATKGWIKIKRTKDKTYEIRSNDAKKKELLPGPEEDFYKVLIRKEPLTISKSKHNSRLALGCEKMERTIESKQENTYFVRNTRFKLRQFIFPIITLVVGLGLRWMYGGMLFVPIAFTVLHLIMNFIFSRLYEQPTPLGRKVLDEIAGFKMYLKYADQDRIKTMNPPTMDFSHYEENLAYAVALGLADEWGGKFDAEVMENMDRNMPYISGFMFTPMIFSNMGHEMSSTISSASTPPASSGSSSGFSGGGGGFGGGGFGGGGGGGW